MKMKLSMLCATLFVFANFAISAPFYVDISEGANTPIEDDGIAGNRKGGWSDEGINDMFIYPPIESGEVQRNGYKFKILPLSVDKNTVIMLEGADNLLNKPEEVKIKIPNIKAKFIYVLQNAVKQAKGQEKNFIVANYTVQYSDGSSHNFQIRDELEIRQWWTGSWWDNSGEKSWPFFIGRNLYSQKWGQMIGVWATQLENPTPEKEISSIILKSEKKSVPVIWAITLDNDNYYKSPELKKDYIRPAAPPQGYFDAKQAVENRMIFEAMKRRGHAKGLQKIEVINDDMIAVTIDSVIAGGSGMSGEKAARLQSTDKFSIVSKDSSDANFAKPVKPLSVGRQSIKFDTVDVEDFLLVQIYWHTYYLKIPPMKDGANYTVKINNLEDAEIQELDFTFGEKTIIPVIKVNQVAYFSDSDAKFAYLGWWAGDLGSADYSKFKKFKVVSEDFETIVMQGDITERKGSETKITEADISGEIVYQMDISKLKKPGRYRIVVPGLGASYSFGIGKDAFFKIYQTVLRGFLFQRCGFELNESFCRFNRPACHIQNYESGKLVYGVNEKYSEGKPILQSKESKEGEKICEFRGSWHDAGDYDLFYSHLMSVSKMLIAYEFAPQVFKDGDAGSSECGNKIPDILDEAEWGLKFYADNQQADGGIFAGRAN